MRKVYLSRRARRMLSVCLAATVTATCIPETTLWNTGGTKVAYAADSTITVDSNATVQQIDSANENRPGVPDGTLLNELKRLVNTSLNRDVKTDITFGELMAYEGEIDLSGIGSKITSISGLGYARRAKKIVLTNVPSQAIPDFEFDGCTGLEEIVLPANLTTIGKSAFRNCKNLKTIQLPDSVTSIGEAAFDACISLEQLDLPTGLRELGKSAFGGCTALKSMKITNGNIQLGASVFEGCKSLKHIELPEGIKEIPASFLASTGIESITVPTTVVEICQGAFMGTFALTSVDLSACTSLTTIGSTSFGASGIERITLSNSVRWIKSKAFESSNLREITIPDTVIGSGQQDATGGIEDRVFWNCHFLKKVSLPKGITVLNEGVFMNCISLTDIEIRDAANSAITSIEKEAFMGCHSLDNTEFLMGLKLLTDIKESAFAYNTKLEGIETRTDIYGNKLYYGGLKNISIPDCVKKLDKTSFAAQYNVEKISLGDGIKELPEEIFSGFVNLRTLKLPKYLTEIGNKAFYNCMMLEELNLPEQLASIGDSAFEKCSGVTKINGVNYVCQYVDTTKMYDQRPAGNTTAGEYLVYESGEHYNQKIVEKVIEKDAILSENAYNKTKPEGYVPMYFVAEKRYVDPLQISTEKDSKKQRYTVYSYDQQEQKVSQVSEVYTSDEGIKTDIAPSTGKNGYYVSIGSTRLNVRYYTGLRKLSIPNGVTKVGERAFADCYNLGEIQMSEQIEVASKSLFAISKANDLYKYDWIDKEQKAIVTETIVERRVKLPEKLRVIGDSAFINNVNMLWTNKELPYYIEEIGASAFEECKELRTVTIPSRTKKIGSKAFYGCSQYTKEKDRIHNYDVYTYDKSQGLNEIDMTRANSLEEIGSFAFAMNPLTNCVIPDKVKVIPEGLFQNCYYLQKVICSDRTETINDRAFSNCLELISITLPAKASVSYNAFCGWDIGEFSFSVTDPDGVSIGLNETQPLPINIYLAEHLRNDMKISEKNGSSGILEFANNSVEEVNKWKILKANVKGLKEGTTKVSMEGTVNFKLYDDIEIAKATEVSVTVNVTARKCTGIEDANSNIVLNVENKNKKTLNPKVLPVDCTEQSVWSTDNEAVVGVEPLTNQQNGNMVSSASANLVAKGLGTSKVTLRCGSVSKDYQVQVVVPATSVKVDVNTLTLKESDEDNITLDAWMTYNQDKYTKEQWEDYGDIIGYSSSDESVVQVTDTGRVIPISAGKADITVKALGSGKSVNVPVTVSASDTQVILKDKDGKELTEAKEVDVQAGETFTIYFGTNPKDSLSRMTYEFGQLTQEGMFSYMGYATENVVTTNKGTQIKMVAMTFKAEKVGSGNISILPAYYQNKEKVMATQKVNVIAGTKDMAFATVDKMVIGQTMPVFGYLITECGTANSIEELKKVTTDVITFESSNPGIATVDQQTGVVTAVKSGSVTITMRATNPYDSRKNTSKKLKLTIQKPDVTAVVITTENEQKVVKVGETMQLKVGFLPENAEDSVTYKSLTPEIASVSSKGLVKGLKAGAAKVQVTSASNKTVGEFEFTVTDEKAVTPTPGANGQNGQNVVSIMKVAGLKLKNVAGKKIAATWKKVTNASGYRMICATDKKFKKNKKTVVVSKNTAKKTVKGLKKGKTYYVKVQAFVKQGNTYTYGKYSAVKKVKIKK